MNARLSLLGLIAGWVWTVTAGGGGVWLMITAGPWPPTNGWFALASGLAACPLLGWALKKYASVRNPGWIQFGAAVFFFVAGRFALTIWPH